MVAWILILGAWIALLLLILHDTTKDDGGGSAVWIAAKTLEKTLKNTLGALMDRAKPKAIALRKALSEQMKALSEKIPPGPQEPVTVPLVTVPSVAVSPATVPLATVEKAPESTSSSSQAPQQAAESLQQSAAPAPIGQTSLPAPSKKRWWRKNERPSMTIAELESAIAEAVRNEPHCEAFVGVIVRPAAPRSRHESNWQIQGIKFGKADRRIASEALAAIVERMQRDFRLADD